jgi:hypothetical protein
VVARAGQRVAGSGVPRPPGDAGVTETIYQSIYVQGRRALCRELAARLRTGRALRKPRRTDGGERRGKTPGMVMISERPAEANDRAVPGHWEGDLILGAGGKSAISTLVERATRFVLLLHLPDGHGADQVAAAMTEVIGHAARAAPPVADLGSGQRDDRPCAGRSGYGPGYLLLRSALAMAAPQQRAAAPVFPQGHGPGRAHPRTPGRDRCRAELPAPQDPGLEDPRADTG